MTASLPFTEQPDGDRTVCVGGKVYVGRRASYLAASGWILLRHGVYLSSEPSWADVCSRIRGDR